MPKAKKNGKIIEVWWLYSKYGETFGRVIAIFRIDKKKDKKVLIKSYMRKEIKEEFAYSDNSDRPSWFTILNAEFANEMWIKVVTGDTMLYTNKKEMDFYRQTIQEKIGEDLKDKMIAEMTQKEYKALDNIRASRISALNWLAIRLSKIVDEDIWIKKDCSTGEVLAILRQLNVELWRTNEIVEVRWNSTIKDKLETLWVL